MRKNPDPMDLINRFAQAKAAANKAKEDLARAEAELYLYLNQSKVEGVKTDAGQVTVVNKIDYVVTDPNAHAQVDPLVKQINELSVQKEELREKLRMKYEELLSSGMVKAEKVFSYIKFTKPKA